jgi:methylenetetrahydrofolate dehydrogenase (NADP+) / methenyltetrahydrofolate cyclohydrolase / formyltetrahydrofolate synthetase
VILTCEGSSNFRFLYDLHSSIEEKIAIISKEIYRADGIELSELAQKQVETYASQGYEHLPSTSKCLFRLLFNQLSIHVVCMAKTQYSFSHDPSLKGAPTGTPSHMLPRIS